MIDAGLLTALELRLRQILQARPEGLSEYELIGALQAGRRPFFDGGIFQDSVSLFRAHFLLFHVLYRLREQLLADRQAHLHIEPLRIQMAPLHAPERSQLDSPDPLRAYYLDLGQLENTGREEIESMLGRFWSRLYADEHRLEALQTLGLSEPVDYETIRRQYRQLVMRHHPDRGGDTARVQVLNEAMAILARVYACEAH